MQAFLASQFYYKTGIFIQIVIYYSSKKRKNDALKRFLVEARIVTIGDVNIKIWYYDVVNAERKTQYVVKKEDKYEFT